MQRVWKEIPLVPGSSNTSGWVAQRLNGRMFVPLPQQLLHGLNCLASGILFFSFVVQFMYLLNIHDAEPYRIQIRVL